MIAEINSDWLATVYTNPIITLHNLICNLIASLKKCNSVKDVPAVIIAIVGIGERTHFISFHFKKAISFLMKQKLTYIEEYIQIVCEHPTPLFVHHYMLLLTGITFISTRYGKFTHQTYVLQEISTLNRSRRLKQTKTVVSLEYYMKNIIAQIETLKELVYDLKDRVIANALEPSDYKPILRPTFGIPDSHDWWWRWF